MENSIIRFSAEDGVTLDGYIHKQEGENKSNNSNKNVLIEIHGMTSNCFKKREKIIAQEVGKINVDTICFNTRGSEIAKYIKDNKGTKRLAGTAYEDIEESYFDVLGAIKYAVEIGYTSIYLQGHSLGSTKVVYTYNKMKKENNKYLKFIKGIILLSLVDIPDMINTYANKEYIKYAKAKAQKGEELELMPFDSFIHPISIKTFLNYVENKNIDFAQYSDKDNKFEVLNSIEVPIFMRWGNVRELIKMEANRQAEFMNKKIKNNKKDIGYISGANHSYEGKEEILAKEICEFIKKWI